MTAIPQQSETISTSEIPLTLTERYKKYLSAAGSETGDELYKSYRANLDKKADGGRIGFAGGKSKAILDLIAEANKKLKGKKSMESVNPKTGEVTVPEEPIKPAEGMTVMDQEPIDVVEGLKNKHKEAFKAHDQIFNVDINDKIAPDMIAESMAEIKGKDYFSLSQKEQSNLYKKALAYVDDVRMTKKQKPTMTPTLEEFKQTNPEAYDEFSKSTNRMQELLNFKSGQETFETFDLEKYNYLNSQEIGRLLNQLKNPYKISDKERTAVTSGFTRENLEGTGLKNLDEINFRTDKKQLETYLDDLYNKKQVEEAETELFNLKDSGREPNAVGGRVGFEKGSIPEEEDEKPSEEYIKSREAGRFKYSFDVQGPDSRTRKSGLPGRTNPKDYGLGITYLSNPSNETAPEIRVGGSRRGAGIEIRKRFKEGGLGYLVGE